MYTERERERKRKVEALCICTDEKKCSVHSRHFTSINHCFSSVFCHLLLLAENTNLEMGIGNSVHRAANGLLQLGTKKTQKLLAAGMAGDTKVVRRLLRGVKHVDLANTVVEPKQSWNLLMVAACYGHSDVVCLLICEFGFQVNQTDVDGWTALSIACARGRLSIVRLLCLSFAADLQPPGPSPFVLAATNGHCDVVEFLMEQMKKVDAKMVEEATMAAAWNDHSEVVEKINKVYNDQVTLARAIFVASKQGNAKVVRMMIANIPREYNFLILYFFSSICLF